MTIAAPTSSVPPPAPGIYPDVAEAEYRDWPAANASLLKVMHQQSPKHVRWELDHPPEETDAMRIGSAFHCLLLRPLDFDAEFIVATTCSAVKKGGGECRNPGKYYRDGTWACGVHGRDWPLPECGVVTEDELATLKAMEASVRGHGRCRKLLEEITDPHAECAIVWTDPATGVPCKGKLDLWGRRDGVPLIVDLKSCGDANTEAFSRQIADFMYQLQAAFYLDGLSIALGGELVENFQFIAIEKEPPFACAPYHLHQEDIALGRAQYRQALAKWKFCHEANAWPGYAGGPIHVPRFYFDRESKNV